MRNLNIIACELLDNNIDVCPPQLAIKHIKKLYGKSFGENLEKENVFFGFTRFKQNHFSNHLVIDWTRKMSEYNDFEMYKREVYQALEDAGAFIVSIEKNLK